MTAAQWGILIPSVMAFLGAGAAYLKSRTAVKAANKANAAIQAHNIVHQDIHNGN